MYPFETSENVFPFFAFTRTKYEFRTRGYLERLNKRNRLEKRVFVLLISVVLVVTEASQL